MLDRLAAGGGAAAWLDIGTVDMAEMGGLDMEGRKDVTVGRVFSAGDHPDPVLCHHGDREERPVQNDREAENFRVCVRVRIHLVADGEDTAADRLEDNCDNIGEQDVGNLFHALAGADNAAAGADVSDIPPLRCGLLEDADQSRFRLDNEVGDNVGSLDSVPFRNMAQLRVNTLPPQYAAVLVVVEA